MVKVRFWLFPGSSYAVLEVAVIALFTSAIGYWNPYLMFTFTLTF